MRQTPGQLQLSATDLANHLACPHLTQQNLKAARGQLEPPRYRDLNTDILRARGFEHEAAYLAVLKARHGYEAARVADDAGETSAIEQTRTLMRQGVPVIVQAALADGMWHGRADVLLRTDTPSALGAYAYEVVDTKLALATRAETILQLCLYAELVEAIQGELPARIGVVTPAHLHGDRPEPQWYRTLDYMAYFRYVRGRLVRSVAEAPDTYPEPVPRCELCRWWPTCHRTWRNDDHLSFVAGAGRSQRRELVDHGITTLTALARTPLPIPFTPSRGARATYVGLREQARVQVAGRTRDDTYWEMKPVESERGLGRLPEPCPGDLYFDIEGDQFAGEGGLEYLLGVSYRDDDGRLSYRCFWSIPDSLESRESVREARAGERAAFEAFMDFLAERRARHPSLHVYHFDHYEPTALKRLMGRYAAREDDIDDLLRRHVFVDLHQVVREALIASVERYSIKDLERFYGFERSVGLHIAGEERARLEHAIELGTLDSVEPGTLSAVRAYNRDDCDSLASLQQWLESIRDRLEADGRPVPRPHPEIFETTEAFDARRARIEQLVASLTEGVPDDPAERSPVAHGRWLLAHCLDYYRRENKVAWWERFRLAECDVEAYLDEPNALGGLELVGRVGGTDRAPIHRYRFPRQEAVMRDADLFDESGTPLGSLEALDMHACTVDIRKRQDTRDHHPDGIYGATVYRMTALEDAVLEIAEWVAANGLDGTGPFRAARDLLLRHPPRLADGAGFDGTAASTAPDSLIDELGRFARTLDHGVLPVQGPPGSGKTYAGARVILTLVRAGRRVGVCANSHRVIQHLLSGVLAAAAEAGMTVAVGAKPKAKGDLDGTGIEAFTSNDRAEASVRAAADTQGAVHVLGGTKFLWSRPGMRRSVDVLMVDEASQISLTDALAIAPSAASLILIGDPRQLDQPQQGTHPPGVEVSALDQLLDGAATMPPTRGVFISRTRRLHPELCAFTSAAFYEDRLAAWPELGGQALIDCGPFDGAGLYFVPVPHTGNQSRSLEEVAVVRAIYEALLEGRWRDRAGDVRPIGPEDLLVVAPYNAQVGALSDVLPDARIGTVDKFQGQEAPVVIYSMATSSQADAPRGMEFLYSANRLNVATSRARCAVILVASPELFDVACRTPAQAALADGFCRYLELARPIPAPVGGDR